MTTFHASAPASRMAHARHPLRLRLISAFQPFSAHSARTSTSISEPNWRRLVSWCIFLPAVSKPGVVVVGVAVAGGGACACASSPPPPLTDRLLVRLTVGDSGISCSCGRDWKPVMQSMTRTLAARPGAGAGVSDGRWAVEE